jgi:hypothetical protein
MGSWAKIRCGAVVLLGAKANDRSHEGFLRTEKIYKSESGGGAAGRAEETMRRRGCIYFLMFP